MIVHLSMKFSSSTFWTSLMWLCIVYFRGLGIEKSDMWSHIWTFIFQNVLLFGTRMLKPASWHQTPENISQHNTKFYIFIATRSRSKNTVFWNKSRGLLWMDQPYVRIMVDWRVTFPALGLETNSVSTWGLKLLEDI